MKIARKTRLHANHLAEGNNFVQIETFVAKQQKYIASKTAMSMRRNGRIS